MFYKLSTDDGTTAALKFRLVSKHSVGISVASDDAATPRGFATSAKRPC